MRPVAAELQRVDVGVEQLLLALELLADQLLDLGDIDVEQRRQRADIDDVLEQLALARVGVFALQIAVSGTPMTVMSSRNFDGGIGLVES